MPEKTNETTTTTTTTTATEKQTNGSTNLTEKVPQTHSSQPNGINVKSDVKSENGKTNGKDVQEEEPPTADVVVPLDGGWGWFVVLASFLCCTVVGKYREICLSCHCRRAPPETHLIYWTLFIIC